MRKTPDTDFGFFAAKSWQKVGSLQLKGIALMLLGATLMQKGARLVLFGALDHLKEGRFPEKGRKGGIS